MRKFVAFVILATSLNGCASIQDWHYEATNCLRAELAWFVVPPTPAARATMSRVWGISGDYRHGWKEGYYDIQSGGQGLPPFLPPQKYWSPSYQNGAGQCAIARWYQGYREGVMAAQQRGAGRFHYLSPYGQSMPPMAGRPEPIPPGELIAPPVALNQAGRQPTRVTPAANFPEPPAPPALESTAAPRQPLMDELASERRATQTSLAQPESAMQVPVAELAIGHSSTPFATMSKRVLAQRQPAVDLSIKSASPAAAGPAPPASATPQKLVADGTEKSEPMPVSPPSTLTLPEQPPASSNALRAPKTPAAASPARILARQTIGSAAASKPVPIQLKPSPAPLPQGGGTLTLKLPTRSTPQPAPMSKSIPTPIAKQQAPATETAKPAPKLVPIQMQARIHAPAPLQTPAPIQARAPKPQPRPAIVLPPKSAANDLFDPPPPVQIPDGEPPLPTKEPAAAVPADPLFGPPGIIASPAPSGLSSWNQPQATRSDSVTRSRKYFEFTP